MSDEPETARPERSRRISPAIWLILIGLVVFVGANAHLLYVAYSTDPECVPHARDNAATDGGYRAAKSAC